MFYIQIWQWKPFLQLTVWRLCLLSLLYTRLFSVLACLLGCSQLTLAVCTVIWLGAVGLGPSADSLLLAHNRSAWSEGPLGAPGSPSCHLWLNRLLRLSQRRDQGSASKASCPLPATWCSISGAFPFHSLHPPLPFYEQVKDMESVQLLPVISFSVLPHWPHAERGWEISPTQTPHNHAIIWCENALLI